MFKTDRPIFRDHALKHYMRNGEKTVLPHFISPPIMILLWCLFGLLLLSASIAWLWRVPVYLEATGQIGMATNGSALVPVVVVLLTPGQVSQVYPGMSAQMILEADELQWQETIATVHPALISPTELRQRYRLDTGTNLPATRPMAVALIPLKVAIPFHLYQGSTVQVKIKVRSQRLLSLLPFLSGSTGAY